MFGFGKKKGNGSDVVSKGFYNKQNTDPKIVRVQKTAFDEIYKNLLSGKIDDPSKQAEFDVMHDLFLNSMKYETEHDLHHQEFREINREKLVNVLGAEKVAEIEYKSPLNG